MAEKRITANVRYRLIGKNNKVIKDSGSTICFATIMRHSLPEEIEKIVVYSKSNNTAYEQSDCKKWIDLIRSFGFDVEYKYNKTKDEHLVIIPINKKNENTKRSYVSSILMFARCLTETSIHKTPKTYWELEEKYKPKTIDEKFQLMQFTHQFVIGNSNHQIRPASPQRCLSLSEFKERADKSQTTIYQDVGIHVSGLWAGGKISKSKDFEAAKNRKNMNVFVVGERNDYINWFPIPLKIVKTLKNAELVVFTGGEDVDPSIYNEPRGKFTSSNLERDKIEKIVFDKAKKLKIPMLGICRGSQFLCVMNGGRLVQHQENPNSIHPIKTDKYGTIKITSTHHQAAFPFNLKLWQYRLIGWTEKLSEFHLDGKIKK